MRLNTVMLTASAWTTCVSPTAPPISEGTWQQAGSAAPAKPPRYPAAMSQIRELDHVGVMVADLEAAGAFLAGTLGLPLEREGEVPALDVKTRFYRCGPVRIEIFQPNDPAVAERELAGAPAKVEHLALRVESLPSALEQLGEQGVRFLHDEPLITGPNLSAYTDPATSAGVMLQLFAPRGD